MDNFRFLCMHRVRVALSQVKALWRVRPGRGIPRISTAYAQVGRSCAQVIHMFVHRQQRGSPLTVLADSSGSSRVCSRARACTRTRGSGLAEIAREGRRPDARCRLQAGRRIYRKPAGPAHPDRPPDHASSICSSRPGYATGHAPPALIGAARRPQTMPAGTEPSTST